MLDIDSDHQRNMRILTSNLERMDTIQRDLARLERERTEASLCIYNMFSDIFAELDNLKIMNVQLIKDKSKD